MRIALFMLILVAISVTPLLIWGDAIDERLGGEAGVAFLSQYGGLAWAVGILLIVSDLVLPVPTPAIMATLGLVYGPFVGGIVGGIGSVAAGSVAYGGCRWMGPRAARFLLGQDTLEKLGRFFDRVGAAAIAFSRWLPVLPEGLACLAGLSRMPAKKFFAALACGSFAMSFAFAWLGAAYQEKPTIGIIVSALVPILFWPVIHRMLNRRPHFASRVSRHTSPASIAEVQ